MRNLQAKIYSGVFIAVMKSLKTKSPMYMMEPGCRRQIGEFCKKEGYKRVLVITDESIRRLGILDKVLEGLEAAELEYAVFDKILPNPTVSMCEAGRRAGIELAADCAVSVGGGSVLDCGKLICAGVSAPQKPMKKLCSALGAFTAKKVIPHFAVPTTAGTGAEISFGAIISDDKTHRKNTAASPLFTYDHVFLDGETMCGMPKGPTAACGIDALSHAVETYLSRIDNPEGMKASLEATQLIMKYLPRVCENNLDMEAREKMAYASMRAGDALSKEMAGYAHPFAHAIGGKYNLPHGNMIAATLIPVLQFEQKACEQKLAALCVACDLGQENETPSVLAARFVQTVCKLRDDIGLSAVIPQLRDEDIPEILEYACKEALTYPVPVYITKEEGRKLLKGLLARCDK